VLHTPGHSPGGVTIACDDAGEAIVGDTLFAGSIGRVDFPTSDPARMHRSLHEVLMRLPDAVRVHPGHGPSTTIGAERRSNPWLQDDGWAEEA
jgi:glyoxylase-like metal-dependent hydrolase (beta-lactamase superfamily II)